MGVDVSRHQDLQLVLDLALRKSARLLRSGQDLCAPGHIGRKTSVDATQHPCRHRGADPGREFSAEVSQYLVGVAVRHEGVASALDQVPEEVDAHSLVPQPGESAFDLGRLTFELAHDPTFVIVDVRPADVGHDLVVARQLRDERSPHEILGERELDPDVDHDAPTPSPAQVAR